MTFSQSIHEYAMDFCEVNQPYIEHFPNHDHIYLNPNDELIFYFVKIQDSSPL